MSPGNRGFRGHATFLHFPGGELPGFLVNVNGAGIREALRLILDYEFSQPDILLLEELEVHLHPGLEVAMMQYLLSISDSCQIFVTTHSTNFIESETSQNIYFVAKQKATSISNLNWGDVVDKVPAELGIQLSSLFMFEVLVFVEGKTDESVLRRFAETLGYNINKNSVGFINMEGIRNFGNFAVNDVLEFLKSRGLDLFFVADRDEKDKNIVELFKNRIGGYANLVVQP